MDKLERIELSLRVLKSAAEVQLSKQEADAVRRIALAYLEAELGLNPGEEA